MAQAAHGWRSLTEVTAERPGRVDVLALAWGRAGTATPPAEVFSVAELVERRGREEMRRPQRPQFDVLVVATDAHLRYTVDFAPLRLAPGQAVRVYPGQVMSWSAPPAGRAGGHVLVAPAGGPLSSGEPWFPGGAPVVRVLDPATRAAVARTVAELRQEVRAFGTGGDAGDGATAAVVEALARLVALRVARGRPSDGPAPVMPEAYVAYRQVLESRLGSTHRVSELAAATGYSVRTLTRACLAVTGRTAKQVLDERLMLEAQRLLAYTDLGAAEVAHRLGYTEPTNFTKTFRRVTGRLPGAARRG